MSSNRLLIRFPASPPTLHCHGWVDEAREWLRWKINSSRVTAVDLVRRLKAVSPDQWFLVGFILLLLAFLIVLLLQPSSVGRGGR